MSFSGRGAPPSGVCVQKPANLGEYTEAARIAPVKGNADNAGAGGAYLPLLALPETNVCGTRRGFL